MQRFCECEQPSILPLDAPEYDGRCRRCGGEVNLATKAPADCTCNGGDPPVHLELDAPEWGGKCSRCGGAISWEPQLSQLPPTTPEARQRELAEAREWIPAHGDERLKLALALRQVGTSLTVYRERRVAVELTGWFLVTGPLKPHRNPSEHTLRAFAAELEAAKGKARPIMLAWAKVPGRGESAVVLAAVPWSSHLVAKHVGTGCFGENGCERPACTACARGAA